MATLKERLRRKNSSGTYDIVHLETDAASVLMADGKTAEVSIGNKFDLTSAGTVIPSNAECNTYVTPGRYYSPSATVSATLSNSPFTACGFSLIVMRNYTTAYTLQIAIGSTTMKLRISTKADGSAWSSWENVTNQTLADLSITATATELNYMDGVTSNVQTQLNGKAEGKRVSITLPATAGWYRIATSAASISNCMGLFAIRGAVSGAHGSVLLSAGISYGTASSASVQVLHCSNWSTAGLTQARIVYHTTYSGKYAYLEVYNSQDKALVLTINMALNEGWTLLTTSTAGSVPEGYVSEAVTFVNNRIIAGSFSGSAASLTTARTIDGVSFDGTAAITHYGSCSTAAATAAKTVACTGFTLVTGASIKVKFTVTNTAANPTLNVNSTGGKAIRYRNAAITAGYLAANRTYEFVYDGTYYQLVGDVDTNTTYTHPTTAGNKHIPSGGSSGQILRWSADGTATWGADNNTTYTLSNITGTLAIAKGGTGLTASPSMLTNLASTTAANILVASPRPGITGTLGLANGGTGKTTAPLALYALVNGSSAITTLADGDYIPVADVSATTAKKITIENLRSVVSVNAPSGVTVPTYPSSIPAVGSTFSWVGYVWRVVHKANGIAWCVTDTVVGTTYWSIHDYTGEYFGSELNIKMIEFGLITGIQFCNFVVDFGAGKVFAPSYDQCRGRFSYFETQENRIAYDTGGIARSWWLCTDHASTTSTFAFTVSSDGSHTGTNRTQNNISYRPCIALQI